MSAGKLSKIENGKVAPTVTDVDLILTALEVSEAAKGEFLRAARVAVTEATAWRVLRRMGPWKHQQAIRAIEAQATILRLFQGQLIPGLLQPTATSPPEVAERHRHAVTHWRITEVPPLETANWLVKSAEVVRGTWEHPKEASQWLGERLAEQRSHFASQADRDAVRLAGKVAYATETLAWGGDVCLGYYLRRPLFLSIAVVACSPNRTASEQPCPVSYRSQSTAAGPRTIPSRGA